MVRTRIELESERRQLRDDITELETELRRLNIRLGRLEVEEAEPEVDNDEEAARNQEIRESQRPTPTQIQIGDRVISRTAPYHNGKVVGFSDDGYWVYILNVRGQRKHKAIHNVERE